ncbi:MAG: BolA family protein [Alphaproteobacteria bacterium]
MPMAEVRVSDPNRDGTHLEAVVICQSFAGKNRIARHRMVYAALGDAFATNLHALQLKTLTPEENVR